MTADIRELISKEDAMEGARYATALHMLRELNVTNERLLSLVPVRVNGADVWHVVAIDCDTDYHGSVVSQDADPLNAVFNAGRNV